MLGNGSSFQTTEKTSRQGALVMGLFHSIDYSYHRSTPLQFVLACRIERVSSAKTGGFLPATRTDYVARRANAGTEAKDCRARHRDNGPRDRHLTRGRFGGFCGGLYSELRTGRRIGAGQTTEVIRARFAAAGGKGAKPLSRHRPSAGSRLYRLNCLLRESP